MLLIVIVSLLRVLSCVQCDEPKITVTGYEDGTANITCPSGGYRDYIKYLWKGTYGSGVFVIRSDGYAEWTHSGRLSLQDRKERDIFTVTIHNLTLEDAGIYGCGIEKIGWDYYTVVMLKVDPKPVNSEVTTRETRSANSMSGHVGYIGVGLTVLMSGLVISLAILYKKKTSRVISALPAGPQPNTNSDHAEQVQCNYAQIIMNPSNPTSTPSNISSSTDSSDIYSNVLPSSNQNPESVDYSPISFDQDHESLPYASVSFTDRPAGGDKRGSTQQHEGDGAVYSTINKNKKT